MSWSMHATRLAVVDWGRLGKAAEPLCRVLLLIWPPSLAPRPQRHNYSLPIYIHIKLRTVGQAYRNEGGLAPAGFHY